MLILTCGLAVLLASICLTVGLAARNGIASTRDDALERLIEDDEDRAGANPLPEHIADATIRFVSWQDGIQDDKRITLGVKLLPD